MKPRPQFRLSTLFIATFWVAVGCLVIKPTEEGEAILATTLVAVLVPFVTLIVGLIQHWLNERRTP